MWINYIRNRIEEKERCLRDERASLKSPQNAGRRRNSRIKRTGVFVILFRGLKKQFWYLLGCTASKNPQQTFAVPLIKGAEPKKSVTRVGNFRGENISSHTHKHDLGTS